MWYLTQYLVHVSYYALTFDGMSGVMQDLGIVCLLVDFVRVMKNV